MLCAVQGCGCKSSLAENGCALPSYVFGAHFLNMAVPSCTCAAMYSLSVLPQVFPFPGQTLILGSILLVSSLWTSERCPTVEKPATDS
jgi:hypothetical protein